MSPITMKAGYRWGDIQPSLIPIPTVSALALSYPEHLSPTYRADALSCWLSILHGYRLGILHFSLGSAFHTICLHWSTSLFVTKHKLFGAAMSIVSHSVARSTIESEGGGVDS